jgi:hypothetical protein
LFPPTPFLPPILHLFPTENSEETLGKHTENPLKDIEKHTEEANGENGTNGANGANGNERNEKNGNGESEKGGKGEKEGLVPPKTMEQAENIQLLVDISSLMV